MSSVIAAAKRTVRWLIRSANPEWETLLVDYRSVRGFRRASDLQWRPVRRCPDGRLDAGGAVVGNRLFVIGGYVSEDRVLSVVDVLDMRSRRWVARWSMPPAMAQSHLGVASDGVRYVFAVSGQHGNHCRPPTSRAFVLDTVGARWQDLPPLPEPRYAPTAQIWQGRLHVLGGSRQDRHTPAADHWSLAVENGRALEPQWRAEPPIPVGGPHRASAVIAGRLYVFGGQLGDYVAIPGDPDCRCTGTLVAEEYYADCFVLEPDARDWTAVAAMPFAASHTESSALVMDGAVYLFGGQCALGADTAELAVTDAVQRYDAEADRWTLVGTLPYRVKTAVVGRVDNWIYAVGGQRDRGPEDARPGSVVNNCWRAQFR